MAKKNRNNFNSKKSSGKNKAKGSANQVTKRPGANTNAVNDEKTGWKTATVTIQLLSDLCIGSGHSYAGIIDSDICYDNYGFPYIPARRIKGCMRECAEEELYAVLDHSSTDIFGKPGAEGDSGILLGDAVLKGIDAKKTKISNLINSGYEEYLTQEKVLSYYTDVRGQTKLVNGVAEENTLRFTRVLCKEEAPVFEMPIMYKEDFYSDIKNIILSLRHLGISRNRGLGSVKCKMESNSTQRRNKLKLSDERSDNRTIITYTVKNVAPLMMCNMEDNVSETFIRGQSVIGLLAKRYLAYKDKTAEDQAFKDLFLNGQTIFSDVVPYHSGKTYYPVPLYINKLKKTSALVNVEYSASEMEKDGLIPEKYKTVDGNLPKKLSGYYWENGSVADFLEVRRTLYHHHRHSDIRLKIKEQLYDMEAISEGQEFIGTVECPSNYAKVIETLFQTDQRTIGNQNVSIVRFGKSKAAQYGTCIWNKIDAKIISYADKQKNEIKVRKNDYIKIDFLSDAIFLDQHHNFTVESCIVESEVKRFLGITGVNEDEKSNNDVTDQGMVQKKYYSILSTGEVAGYSGIWKTQKQPIPVIRAGSALIFCNKEDCKIPTELRIGEKRHEGFGHIRVSVMSDKGYAIDAISEHSNYASESIVPAEPNEMKDILKYVIKKDLREHMKIAAYYHKDLKITSSLIGRVDLMYHDALGVGETEDDKFRNFAKRIESIKTDSAKNELENNLLDMVGNYLKNEKLWELDSNKLFDLLKSEKEQKAAVSQILRDYANVSGQEDKQLLIKELWRDYVSGVLISQKYRNKDREDSGEETVNEEQSD